VETDFRPLFDTILIIAPAEASTLEDPEQPAGQDD
jgi:hypothetical protein